MGFLAMLTYIDVKAKFAVILFEPLLNVYIGLFEHCRQLNVMAQVMRWS